MSSFKFTDLVDANLLIQLMEIQCKIDNEPKSGDNSLERCSNIHGKIIQNQYKTCEYIDSMACARNILKINNYILILLRRI